MHKRYGKRHAGGDESHLSKLQAGQRRDPRHEAAETSMQLS